MTEFFEAFNPAARHWREQQDLQKVLVAQTKRSGRGPQPMDLDSGSVRLVHPGQQVAVDGPELRQAQTARELERAGRVAVRAYLDGGVMTHTDPYLAELRDAAGRAEQGEVWLALDGGSVVGTVTWCPPGSTLREQAHDDEGTFRVLAVDPSAQHRGIARLLVQQMLQRGRDEGRSSIFISSADWMTPAHALYRSLGFRRVPDRDWIPVPGVTALGFVVDLD